MRSDRARQVVVAGDVVIAVVEQFVKEGIAAAAEQVVAAAAVGCRLGGQGVVRDRDHRPQVRETGPEPVEGGYVGALQLARARGPEPLAWVVQTPEVEVADLRSFYGDDAHDAARSHGPRISTSDRDYLVVRALPAIGRVSDASVEVAVQIEPPGHIGVAIQPDHLASFCPTRLRVGT